MKTIEIFSDFIDYQWSHHCHLSDDVQLEGIIRNVMTMIRFYVNYGLNEEDLLNASGLDLEALSNF